VRLILAAERAFVRDEDEAEVGIVQEEGVSFFLSLLTADIRFSVGLANPKSMSISFAPRCVFYFLFRPLLVQGSRRTEGKCDRGKYSGRGTCPIFSPPSPLTLIHSMLLYRCREEKM
jgi:hypothetical protein